MPAILLEGILVSEDDHEVLQELSHVSIGEGQLLEVDFCKDILVEKKSLKRRQHQ